MRYFLVALVLCLFASTAYAQDVQPQQSKVFEINTALFESTFLIVGPSFSDKTATVIGTAFLLGRPLKENPAKSYPILVTADHVLNGIGQEALIIFRQKENASYKITEHKIRIRDKEGCPLWTSGGLDDVGVMYIPLPFDLTLIPFSLLGTDEAVKKYELHPGDELLALGYPLGYFGPGVYPVLRGGRIASYPLTPSKETRGFLFDFQVYQGNSGGPVYFIDEDRTYGGAAYIGQRIQFIVGLVSKQVIKENTALQLGIIVPSELILETIKRLPDKPTN